ncbi:MAG: diguanylate cyclase [Actinomycetota bacterium]
MSLRSRLSTFFVAIVVVPVAGAALTVLLFVPRELSARAFDRLHGAAATVAAIQQQLVDRATFEVSTLANSTSASHGLARRPSIQQLRKSSGLDYLVIGHAIAIAPGVDASKPFIAEAKSRLANGTSLRGGFLVSDSLANLLSRASGASIRITRGSRVIASAGPAFQHEHSLGVMASHLSISLSIAPRRLTAGLAIGLGLIAAIGLAVACMIGFALSKAIARPLADLAESAEAIAKGDYERRVSEGGRDEVGQLGRAFNRMASSVQAYVHELRDSRDELRHTLERLGATLRSTRGIEEMLRSLLEASASALGANAGALFRLANDGTLGVESTIGLEAAQATRDVAAMAVRENRPVLAHALGGMDPFGRLVVAAPLSRGDVIIGAIAIIGHSDRHAFGEYELSTLASFAAQASVAIDNVFLREEAQRLSLTDPLTGIANRRALERKLEREVDRSKRYARPVGVLMCDLDHFKSINDRLGHLDGDRVLVEAAHRMASVVRHGVDFIARYGGEEFVIVLPETDAAGAMAVATKICEAMDASAFPVGGGTHVTLSVGVATIPGDGSKVDDLLHAADLALYRAKQEGRNRVVGTEAIKQVVSAGGRL